jgi:murein DD-endopeptidase MepM/ murein hydrolase activator NlpD
MLSTRTHTLGTVFLALAMLFCVSMQGGLTRAEDLETDFDELRTQYSDTWQQAVESTRRSTQLEQQLNAASKRVVDARAKAEKAEQDKQNIRAQARDIRTLTLALTKQLTVLHKENEARRHLFEEQKEVFGDFVRIHALSSELSADTGPVAGGVVMRRLLHGSLGDQIQSELHSEALLQARSSILMELLAEANASKKAEDQLNDTAKELADRLDSLKALHASATDESSIAANELTEAVTQHELTEAEYGAVKQAMDEQLGSVRSLQNSISAIQQQLKEFRDRKFAADLETTTALVLDLTKKEQALMTKESQLEKLTEDAQAAYETAQAARNTDKNTYRDIEQTKLDIKNKKERLAEIAAMPVPGVQDPESLPWQEYRKAQSEVRSLTSSVSWLQDELSFMKTGWTKNLTDVYLKARAKAQDAHEQLPHVSQELNDVRTRLSDAQAKLVSIQEEKTKNSTSIFAFNLLPGSSAFVWPVRGRMTAGYLDSAYEAHFRVPHRAIDIAVSQGTPVFAARDGVVYTVKNGGATGYSYVLIAHDDGYSTIYGHLSAMYVSPGQLIEQGHVIGLSGGKLGTPGAGWMTTGPHLHFEVHKDGKSVNPLSVLP